MATQVPAAPAPAPQAASETPGTEAEADTSMTQDGDKKDKDKDKDKEHKEHITIEVGSRTAAQPPLNLRVSKSIHEGRPGPKTD